MARDEDYIDEWAQHRAEEAADEEMSDYAYDYRDLDKWEPHEPEYPRVILTNDAEHFQEMECMILMGYWCNDVYVKGEIDYERERLQEPME